jgi:hypothetical protein
MAPATLFLSLALLGADGIGGAPSSDRAGRAESWIADSQLTLRSQHAKGQATVIAVSGQRLAVVTAAHFLSDRDVDHAVLVLRADVVVPGRLAAVARNPAFERVAGKGPSESAARSIGVDTAVALIVIAPRSDDERRAMGAVRAVDWTETPFPRIGGQVLPVHIMDQFGVEHIVRAGNHLNPKCLAWGRTTYAPQHGDSGAGVFVLRRTQSGALRPLLIGNVSQTDDRGGIASLAYRSADWVEDALNPVTRAATDDRPAGR